jgi:hypothetical protein
LLDHKLCFSYVDDAFVCSLEKSATSGEVTKDGVLQAGETNEKCSEGKFLSVADLSSAVDRSSGAVNIDMVYDEATNLFFIVYLHIRCLLGCIMNMVLLKKTFFREKH